MENSPGTTATSASTTIKPSHSDPASFQGSLFSSYIRNLSPIESVTVAHVAHDYARLCSPSLILRPPCPQSSSVETSSDKDRTRKVAVSPDNPKKCGEYLLSSGLIPCNDQKYDIEPVLHSQPCVPSKCVGKYLTYPVEVDHVNIFKSDDLSCTQGNDTANSSEDDFIDSSKPTVDLERNKDTRKNTELVMDTPQAPPEQFLEDQTRKETSNFELVDLEQKQMECDIFSNGCSTLESTMFMGHAQNELRENIATERKDTDEGYDENFSAKNLEGLAESLHENEASQHMHKMRRRLHFEEAYPKAFAYCTTSDVTMSMPCSRPPSSPAGSSFLRPSCVKLSATLNNGQHLNSFQTRNAGSSLGNKGSTCIIASRPSGIGLHLNSIVNAVPISCVPHIDSSVGDSETVSVERQIMNSLSASCTRSCSIGPEDDKHISDSSTFLGENRLPNKFECVDSVQEFNQGSPRKKRKKALNTSSEASKRCNCKKTKCLKLYCDCFAAGIYCTESCACQGCFNGLEYEATVHQTRQQIESRNPFAFAPKIVPHCTDLAVDTGGDKKLLEALSARHKSGCNCKKSTCRKKYCECYQANVGCSNGCRCEGCKNVFGRKEDYGVFWQRVNGETLESVSDEKLKTVAGKRNSSRPESREPRKLTPVRPLLKLPDNGKDVSKSQIQSDRRLPSPESDLTVLSSSWQSSCSPRTAIFHEMLVNTSREVLDSSSHEHGFNYSSSDRVDRFSPTHDATVDLCNEPPRAAASVSSRTREYGSRVQSHSAKSQPTTTTTCRLGGTKSVGLDDGLINLLEDEPPDVLKDAPTLANTVKVSSPNKKRVSPPQICLREFGSRSSACLRGGRRFILQAVPSFPPLAPCIDAKGGDNQNRSHLQKSNSKQ